MGRCGAGVLLAVRRAHGREHTWTTISGHSCGRYSEEASQRIDEAQRNVKRYTVRPPRARAQRPWAGRGARTAPRAAACSAAPRWSSHQALRAERSFWWPPV